ncbi:MAG: single-stranded DNA-binding protein [Desulfovibrionaceae bacterium]|nr:single-stranded DNA-binding protein [Desulfovibrionaceae bacterium]MBF0515239.1 single-stranded DNA-binding protein [Desulfovibrionaceae bacterium]
MNHVFVSGHLGENPVVSYSRDGNPWATFDLAFKSGKQKTGWIKCVCFKFLAEACEKYLHKGAKVTVLGSLTHETWENDKGEKRSGHKLLANSIEFLKTDGRGFETSSTSYDDVPFGG